MNEKLYHTTLTAISAQISVVNGGYPQKLRWYFVDMPFLAPALKALLS